MRRWTPAHFRATLQAYFLPASLVGIAGFAIVGLLVREVFYLYGVSLIAAIPAIFIGRSLNRRLRRDTFLRGVYVGLIGLGALLLAQALIVVH